MKEVTPPKKASAADYLANERTFLAWIRTGIAIMAFGFVVVKFGFFINQMAFLLGGKAKLPDASYSSVTGVALVALGTIMSLLSYLRYRQVQRSLEQNEFISHSYLPGTLISCILFAGVLLVIYLSL